MNIKRAIVLTALLMAGCSFAAPTPTPAPRAADPIVVTPPPGPANALPPLQVSLSANGTSEIMLGTPTTFYASTTAAMGTVSYRWAYSDGGNAPASPASQNTHTFAGLGAATITVTATDTRGATSATVTGTVIPVPVATTTSPTTPTITTPPTPTVLTMTLTCTAQAKNVASTCNFAATWMGVPLPSYGFQRVVWDWGDGTGDVDPSRSPVHSHVYGYSGSYIVAVNVLAAPTDHSGSVNGAASTTLTIK